MWQVVKVVTVNVLCKKKGAVFICLEEHIIEFTMNARVRSVL